MVNFEDKPKQPEQPTQDQVKQQLIDELSKESVTVLTLSLLYARGYDIVGENITTAWTNAVRNNQIIEAAYERGYNDCLKDLEDKKIRDFAHKVLVDLKE